MKIQFAGIAVCALFLTACNMNPEEMASNIPAKKTPGYARVVNLTKDGVEFISKNRPVCATTGAFEASELVPIGEGAQTLKIQFPAGKPVEVKTTLASDKGTSIILMPDHSTKEINNEVRYATSTVNVYVHLVDAGGKMPSKFKISDKEYDVKEGLQILVPEGPVTFSDGGSSKISDRIAYSLFIIAGPDKVHYALGKNASDRKPGAGGMSAS